MESRPSPTLQPGVKPQPTQRARLRNTCWHCSHCIFFWAAARVEGNTWNVSWKQILHNTVHLPQPIGSHKTLRFLLVGKDMHRSSLTWLLTHKSKPQVRYFLPTCKHSLNKHALASSHRDGPRVCFESSRKTPPLPRWCSLTCHKRFLEADRTPLLSREDAALSAGNRQLDLQQGLGRRLQSHP